MHGESAGLVTLECFVEVASGLTVLDVSVAQDKEVCTITV